MVRFKNRYLLVKVETLFGYSREKFTKHDVLNAIKSSIRENLGEFQLAKTITGLKAIYFNYDTRLVMIRCLRSSYRSIRSAMFFVDSINGNDVKLNCIRCSGTIKKTEEMIQDYNFRLNAKSAK